MLPIQCREEGSRAEEEYGDCREGQIEDRRDNCRARPLQARSAGEDVGEGHHVRPCFFML